jgi:hypothetical protein
MPDTIRAAAIGFAFGAVAGIVIGAWYVRGMDKLGEEGPASLAPDEEEPKAVPEERTATFSRGSGDARASAQADGPTHTFDELPEAHRPVALQRAAERIPAWIETQDPSWGLQFVGLDCAEPPCILHLQTAVLDGDASTAMQQALHEDFHDDLFPPGSSHVSTNTVGETTTFLRYVVPTVDEGLAEDLELMAKRRIEALLEEEQE